MSNPIEPKEESRRFLGGESRRLLRVGLAACLTLAVVLAAASCQSAGSGSQSVPDQSEEPAVDVTPPRLLGVRDLTVALNGTASYRDGISAEDDTDGPVAVQIDAAAVDLTAPGEYPVIYSAQDAAGNRVEQTVTVTVVETATADQGADEPTEDETPSGGAGGGGNSLDQVTQEDVDRLADEILKKITNSGMSQWDQAKAIFNYVNSHIKYVGSSDKSSWIIGAYVGFTRGRGDCYNYFACSKALLTRAGIPNVDLTRVGGNSRHYWQLVNTGDGWYHFDACPHPTGYPLYAFMITETQARTYTEQVKRARLNYYVYDYDSCPVEVEGMPPEGWRPAVSTSRPAEAENPEPPGEQQPEELPGEGGQPPEGETPEDPGVSQDPGLRDPITGELPGGAGVSGGGLDPTAPPPDQGENPGGGWNPTMQPPELSGEGEQLAA